MRQRIHYHVVHRSGEWHVVKWPGNIREGRFRDKADAVDLGRYLAMRESAADLRISKLDGSVQSEITFGKNPQEIEG